MRFYRYRGRVEAGRQLAPAVRMRLAADESPIVLSIPRGGVVIGAVLAEELAVPHDIVVARKIAEEGRPEWSVGAVSETGDVVWDRALKSKEEPAALRRRVRAQWDEARRRLREFRGRRPPRRLKGRTVILTDDGIARGWTLLAAVKTLKAEGARRIIVAVPVSSRIGAAVLRKAGAEVVALYMPKRFMSVSRYYRRFSQVSDERVKRLLRH